MSLIKFQDFYGVWSKTVTETCLPLFSSADPASELSRRITFVLCSFEWYYETLNSYAEKYPKTIPYLLFPSWRNSLEKPILFLGDIHPYLLTNLLRSLINRVNQYAGENPAASEEDPYVELLKTTEELEGEVESRVSHLLDRMSKAHIRFAARFSDDWVKSYDSSQWRTVMKTTAASMAMDEAVTAKEEIMKELVSIFVDANLLRMKLIKDIVDATSGQILMLASLFLESVCRTFSGFKDKGQEFHNSLSASSLMNHHHTSEPAPPTYQNFPVMNRQPTPAGNQAPEINNNAPIPEYTIYVGDLSYQVKAFELGRTFRERYPSVKAAKVAFFRDKRLSRGYGFVSFSDVNEQRRAMTEMNGRLFYDKPMRIGLAKRMPRSNEAFDSFTRN